MILRCKKCNKEDTISIHKDGLELVTITCKACLNKIHVPEKEFKQFFGKWDWNKAHVSKR